jgi:hypothetical protein
MTILLYGKSKCPLCGQVINETEPVYCFPAFVINELDPCFFFSDAAFHEVCLKQHPYGSSAIRSAEEYYSKVGPGKRKCVVCKEEVTDSDDYFLIGRLSDRNGDPLRAFNYTHLHKSCIPKWRERLRFIDAAKAALTLGVWKGRYLNEVIDELATK